MAPRKYPEYLHKNFPPDKFICEAKPEPWRVQNLFCCGIKEIHGVQNVYTFSKKGLGSGPYIYEQPSVADQIAGMKVALTSVEPPRPIWIFSDADKKNQPGEAIAKYIEEHELGTVTRSGYHRNPNSGNLIQMYTWLIHNERFARHKPKV